MKRRRTFTAALRDYDAAERTSTEHIFSIHRAGLNFETRRQSRAALLMGKARRRGQRATQALSETTTRGSWVPIKVFPSDEGARRGEQAAAIRRMAPNYNSPLTFVQVEREKKFLSAPRGSFLARRGRRRKR